MVLFLVLLFSLAINAQTVISVDENISRNKGKSLVLPVLASAALPGAGHFYLGEKSRAQAFFWVDASLWAAALSTYYYSENQLENARGYAVKHAGAEGISKDLALLSLVGQYRSRGGSLYQNSSPGIYEDYNQAMIRAGYEIDKEYPYTHGYIWDWGSSDNPETTAHIDEYNKMLRRHRIANIAFQVGVGAMALNRIAAILDALRIYRKTATSLAHLQITPLATPQKSGIFVNYGF